MTYFKYNEVLRIERKAEQLKTELETQAIITLFAGQLPHDIRSPLALLDIIAHHTSLPHELREMLRMGKTRLQGISDSLLEKGRQIHHAHSRGIVSTFQPSSESIAFTEIYSILNDFLEEKRRVYPTIGMEQFISDSLKITRCKIQPNELKKGSI